MKHTYSTVPPASRRMRISPAFLLLLPLFFFVSPREARPTPVSDTGQTASYTATFGEDSNYLINPPSFTKLDTGGNDLPDSASSWIMVRDNVTGLIWEVKTSDGSVHDKSNQYTWYDSNPATNGGDAGTMGDGTDTEDFINALNADSFGGYSDWRLPTVKELGSIAYLRNYDPAIDIAYFPNTVSADYWSSSPNVLGTGNAWGIYYYYGYGSDNSKSGAYYVRAVRGTQSEASGHWVINGDDTVTDTSTGLMWQQGGKSQMDWEGAISYCEGLSLANYKDWRLPNSKELRSIADLSVYDPAIDTAIFPDAASSNYWSATTDARYKSFAWGINCRYGNDYSYVKTTDYYVRAVRGGQDLVTGHLAISSPAQGSTWSSGSSMPIRWDTQGISGNVKIWVSRQGGGDGTFETVIESTENDGIYDWIISAGVSVNCALRIEPLSDATKGTTQGFFSIEEGASIMPPTVTTGAVTGLSATSATLTGTINPNGDSTTVRFEWGPDTGYGNEVIAVQSPLTGTTAQTVTAALTGLALGQTYHFRLSATNSVGTGDGADISFTTATKEIVRKAIIVAGSGPYETNDLWDATIKCTIAAYAALMDQGYTPEKIYFLSAGNETDVDGDGVADVDNGATNANLEYALKTWAPGADNLFIYLVGHGQYGKFEISEWETLSAQDFDSWLDSAQNAIPDFVAVLYDACRSGSFMSDLQPPVGKMRVLVASAGADERAIFQVEGGLSFGFQFFSHLHNGARFYDSFERGKKSVEAAFDSKQNPEIEANGNGDGNEKIDKELAEGIQVGLEKVFASEIPRIQSASPPETLAEGATEASIYALNVQGDGITEVFAIIKPPNYVSDSPENPVTDLPILQLVPLGNRYQGTYTGFTAPGDYNIAIFAKDENGSLSLPVQTMVTVPGDSACLKVASDFSIQVPCAQYNGNQYGFLLDFYRHPDDSSGYYWKLIMATLSTGTGSACIPIGGDLSMPIPCMTYSGRQYGVTLRFYKNPYDPDGLYWNADMSTLAPK